VHRLLLHILAVNCALFVCAQAFATPAEEISRAVAAQGVADVSSAHPRQYQKAFTAVALRVSPRALPEYVIAAINLRPDQASTVVTVAVKAAVKNSEAKPVALCTLIERIVTAAIAAKPESAVAIAKAAVQASPQFRRCALAAAIAAAPDARVAIIEATKQNTFIFPTFTGGESSGFAFNAATLNPANISEPGDDDSVNSPEQPPSH
jgi:hypothetical protein